MKERNPCAAFASLLREIVRAYAPWYRRACGAADESVLERVLADTLARRGLTYPSRRRDDDPKT